MFTTANKFNILHAAGVGRSSSGLDESHQKIRVHMSKAYLINKYTPNCWFHSVHHVIQATNHIPVKCKNMVTSPSILVHCIHSNCCALSTLFSVCGFHTNKNEGIGKSHNEIHTMAGIILDRDSNSNVINVHNP
jgi:hypothetical protein